MRVSPCLVLVFALSGCYEVQHYRPDAEIDEPDDDGGIPPGDADEPTEPPRPSRSHRVDLLFVVDNSNSMGEEQAVLAEQVETMVRRLVEPEPDPVTGRTPRAVEDLHVGVVSTDMGTGGYTIMTCANPMAGDNGVLQASGRLPGCAPEYGAADCDRASCPWLSHSRAAPDLGDDPDDPPLWEDFACIATLGTGGCGFEQQLEASLAALTTQTQPGRPNEGFLRDDSVLAVVYLTDEDDCSSGNPELFNPSRDDLGPLNVRCALREDMLLPVSRYRDGLLALRPGREDLVVVGAIVGVPIDGSWNVGEPIDALRALRQVNPSNPSELLPSCRTPMGLAFPPVRIAELVYAFGARGVLGSICQPDFAGVLDSLVARVQERLAP